VITPGGAKPIVESGAIDHVDKAVGNHLWATTPLGTLQTRPGVFMAGTDKFEITVKGKGGHGAYPHETKDALLIGADRKSTRLNSSHVSISYAVYCLKKKKKKK